MKLNRRVFLGTGAAALGAKVVPLVAARSRVILTLVREKGVLRAVERVVPR